jgi:hypothetical protein
MYVQRGDDENYDAMDEEGHDAARCTRFFCECLLIQLDSDSLQKTEIRQYKVLHLGVSKSLFLDTVAWSILGPQAQTHPHFGGQAFASSAVCDMTWLRPRQQHALSPYFSTTRCHPMPALVLCTHHFFNKPAGKLCTFQHRNFPCPSTSNHASAYYTQILSTRGTGKFVDEQSGKL